MKIFKYLLVLVLVIDSSLMQLREKLESLSTDLRTTTQLVQELDQQLSDARQELGDARQELDQTLVELQTTQSLASREQEVFSILCSFVAHFGVQSYAEERGQLSREKAQLLSQNEKLNSDILQLRDENETHLSQLDEQTQQLAEFEQQFQVIQRSLLYILVYLYVCIMIYILLQSMRLEIAEISGAYRVTVSALEEEKAAHASINEV